MKPRFEKKPLVDAVLKELGNLPDGTETSTSECLDRLFTYKTYKDAIYHFETCEVSTDEFFEIDRLVRMNAKKEGLIVDDSKHAGMALGLPFHIPFTIRKK